MFIGFGTQFCKNMRISCNVIIGSDSLANKDIPNHSVYAGVSTTFICACDVYLEKARVYSAEFRNLYGADRLSSTNDKLAKQIYENLQKEKDQKRG